LMTAEESKDSANGDVCCKYGNGYWYVQKLVDVFRWNFYVLDINGRSQNLER
jgi:hypothetical protein